MQWCHLTKEKSKTLKDQTFSKNLKNGSEQNSWIFIGIWKYLALNNVQLTVFGIQ